MKCNEIKNDLYFYVRNELDISVRVKIEKHIAECPSCRELLEGFSKTLKTVDENIVTVSPENPALLTGKILEKIYQPRPFKVLKPAIAFALSLFIFVFGYQYYRSYQSRGGENGLKNVEESVMLPETEELVAYLTNFDVPELYQ